jgi:hypothetical protein
MIGQNRICTSAIRVTTGRCCRQNAGTKRVWGIVQPCLLCGLLQVFPFCYTFPGNDPSKTEWVDTSMAQCPLTTAVLKSIPGLRTALFSRLGPHTVLGTHQVTITDKYPCVLCEARVMFADRVGRTLRTTCCGFTYR